MAEREQEEELKKGQTTPEEQEEERQVEVEREKFEELGYYPIDERSSDSRETSYTSLSKFNEESGFESDEDCKWRSFVANGLVTITNRKKFEEQRRMRKKKEEEEKNKCCCCKFVGTLKKIHLSIFFRR